MGVLDDAIREHLDLKRRRGARENEIKELEDEAFGLPSRPGEPDFPERKPGETGEQAAAPESAEETTHGAVAEAPEEAPEAAEVEVPAEPEPPQEDAPRAEGDAPSGPEAAERELVGSETREWIPPDVIEEPQSAEEETGAEEAPFAEAEPEEPATAEEPATFEDDLGVDELDLSLDDEDIPEPGVPSRGAEAPEVEHDEEEEESEGGWEEDEDFEEDVEDVLEETPEFLRDAPGSDDLWFEQGEPQDFDFEDEEE